MRAAPRLSTSHGVYGSVLNVHQPERASALRKVVLFWTIFSCQVSKCIFPLRLCKQSIEITLDTLSDLGEKSWDALGSSWLGQRHSAEPILLCLLSFLLQHSVFHSGTGVFTKSRGRKVGWGRHQCCCWSSNMSHFCRLSSTAMVSCSFPLEPRSTCVPVNKRCAIKKLVAAGHGGACL